MYFCDMKVLYILFGTLSLALGIIGIFLPLLPTTPFLLLTAALYVRSSPRLYNRLLHHKYLGSYIRNFRENKAIPLRAKIISVSLIWITILNCIFFIVPYWWLKAVLLLIAAGTSYHILSFSPFTLSSFPMGFTELIQSLYSLFSKKASNLPWLFASASDSVIEITAG